MHHFRTAWSVSGSYPVQKLVRCRRRSLVRLLSRHSVHSPRIGHALGSLGWQRWQNRPRPPWRRVYTLGAKTGNRQTHEQRNKSHRLTSSRRCREGLGRCFGGAVSCSPWRSVGSTDGRCGGDWICEVIESTVPVKLAPPQEQECRPEMDRGSPSRGYNLGTGTKAINKQGHAPAINP